MQLSVFSNLPLPISLSELESFLWGAAILLRGLIDAGDYKQYIFPLLFYKRLCDVFDEEFQHALTESNGDVDYAQLVEHRFKIPLDAHWNDVRSQTSDLGKALQNAMRAIEQANPDTLSGIFGDAPWTNKGRLSDRILRDLIDHFSKYALSLANVPEDELGIAYEYLIKKFADDSGHTAAEFYTNRTVVRLMTEILEPQEGESIYDPTCGSGGMLLSCAVRLKDQNKEYRTLKLYGQERNLITSSIARMNLFLHGYEDFRIERDDTLSDPKFIENDRLRQFDVVLANPPYSIKQWNRKGWESDPYGRNFLGVPTQGRADYAFFQHILKSLKPGSGRCAILFPHGVLFRDEEREMRKKLIDQDLVECVIGLGPNLFYNSPMEACIVICRTQKAPERRGKILLINAVNDVTRERAQSYLEEEHIKKLVTVYRSYEEVEGFSRVVTQGEVIQQNASLNIALYVRNRHGKSKESISKGDDLPAVISDWQASSKELRASLAELIRNIQPPQ